MRVQNSEVRGNRRERGKTKIKKGTGNLESMEKSCHSRLGKFF